MYLNAFQWLQYRRYMKNELRYRFLWPMRPLQFSNLFSLVILHCSDIRLPHWWLSKKKAQWSTITLLVPLLDPLLPCDLTLIALLEPSNLISLNQCLQVFWLPKYDGNLVLFSAFSKPFCQRCGDLSISWLPCGKFKLCSR